MVGTAPDVRGGISTVVRGYVEGGLFDRYAAKYVVTHRDGSGLRKARVAVVAYLKFAGLMLTSRAPLLHIHLASRASFWRKSLICAMGMIRRRPYLLHVHGAEFSKFYDRECGVLSKAIVRFVLRRAVTVIALSEQWQAELLRISPRAQVRVLPNAVSLHANPVDTTTTAAPRIVFAGRIGPRKGTFDLLEAFAHIAQRFPGATLVCAGDGEVEKLQLRARELGIASRVVCPGWLSPEQMSEELRRASIFALPSYAEGVPMAMLEAMSLGLPVLTTPVGGIPNVVQSGVNGVLVTPGNVQEIETALADLLASGQRRASFGAAARETIASRFDRARILDRLAAIYRDVGLEER